VEEFQVAAGGDRSFHLLLRLIVRVVDYSPLHAAKDCLDNIQKLRARWKRDEFDDWSSAPCPIPCIEGVSPLHEFVRTVPRGGIPSQVYFGFRVILIEKHFGEINNPRRVFGFAIEPSHLVSCTVLLTSNICPVRFRAARTLWKMSSDGARQAKAHGGDRPWDVPLHRGEPRAGGSLRVRQAL